MLQSFPCTLLNDDTQMFHCDKKHKTKKRKYKIVLILTLSILITSNVNKNSKVLYCFIRRPVLLELCSNHSG